MTLVSKAREFGKKYPTPKASPSSSTDLTWDQNCGIAMFQFGSFLGWLKMPVGDISSARRAASTSKIESKDYTKAPLYAYHWFDIGGWGNGHVMQQVDDGTLIFGGTRAVWENVGVALGFMDVPTYLRLRPTATYLGWSLDYSGGRVKQLNVTSSSTSAVIDSAPITNLKTKENDMRLFWDTVGTGYLSTDLGSVALPSMQVYTLFQREIRANQSVDRPDTFLREEVSVLNSFKRLLALQSGTQILIDYDKLVKTINLSLPKPLDYKVVIDPAILAAALDVAIPKIATAVNRDAAARLAAV